MTRDEGFLRRWSRRKQAASAAETVEVQTPAPSPFPAAPEPGAFEPGTPEAAAPGVAPEAVSEIAPQLELPPLESLTAASDFTAFLQKGVSAELQSRALRVAWESDECIAGFRGMAEYAWDFNAPGYGKLWATDDVVKMVQEALRGAAAPEADEDAPAPEGAPLEERPAAVAEGPSADPAPAVDEGPTEREAGAVAALPEAETPAPGEIAFQNAGARRHGSALPS